jgi:hypothetical protein
MLRQAAASRTCRQALPARAALVISPLCIDTFCRTARGPLNILARLWTSARRDNGSSMSAAGAAEAVPDGAEAMAPANGVVFEASPSRRATAGGYEHSATGCSCTGGRSFAVAARRGGSAWSGMNRIAARWLPRPRIHHPYPAERLCV